MGAWAAARRWVANALSAFTFSAESNPRPIDRMIMDMLRGSGSVSRAEALSVPAFLRGRNSICSISTLPLVQVGPDRRRVDSSFLRQIDPDVPNVVTLAQTVEDLLCDGIAWWYITAEDFNGFPLAARHVSPGSVSIIPAGERTPHPLPSGHDPRNASLWLDGRYVTSRQLKRFDSPNPGVLTGSGRVMRRAILLDKAAGMYAKNPMPLSYFTEAPDAIPLKDHEVITHLDQWEAHRAKRVTGFVRRGLLFNVVQSPTPRDLQLVELQTRAALDIANLLGLDPEEVGVAVTSRTYFNAQDRRQSRVNDILAPYMRAITDRLSMGDITRRGHAVTFDLTDYMKADPTTRVAYYQGMKALGAIDAQEVRDMEGIPGPAPAPEEEEAPGPAPVGGVEASRAMVPWRPRTAVNFDGPAMFTMDATVTGFSVDTERRTISGLAVPYGKPGEKYGQKFRFAQGSITWSDVSRVKHYKDHVVPIGRALELKAGRAGLAVKLSVMPGDKGDELLSEAQHGVYDGLSVGVDFSMDPNDGDIQLGRDGVYTILRATLREVSTTSMPAFDDARVTKVAASKQGGQIMPCAHCGQIHADGVVTCPSTLATFAAPPPTPPPPAGFPATFDAATVGQMLMALTQGTPPAAAPAAPAAPTAPAAPDGPAAVNSAHSPGPAQVFEAAPYRFDRDGNLTPGTHDFSRDLYAGFMEHDKTALERATAFVHAQFAAFDVATGDVNELNPPKNRPEMYVDQREYRYPIWNAISKGTLADITPFVFPKFNAASGFVNNHTEGVEPTSGTMTSTSQTVTPTAVSGKAKITRETWDQGGNPQVSALIWRQMVRGWYEALEAAAVALLDAATPTSLATFTTGGGTTGQTLVAELKAAITGLQFIRGGYSFTDAFAQVDLYKALSASRDNDGAPLLPILSPSNRDGTAAPRLTSIDVDGVQFLPAWALAASGIVAASSYLFDRECVHGWASAPNRLDITMTEVAHVYIGLWGYKATAISDLNGVREIIYDPA